MKRRVLFCFHDSEATGASLWLRNFLLVSPPEAWEPHAVFPGKSAMMEDLGAAGIPCHSVSLQVGDVVGGGSLLGGLRNRIATISEYRKLMRDLDVSLVYTNSSVQIASMIAAKKERRPLVVHVHEGHGHFHAGGRRSRTFPLKRWALRRLPSGCLFAATEGMRLFGGAPSGVPWEFSPNGVDPSLANPPDDREVLRRELDLDKDSPVVLFLGSLCERKGVPDLLEAWQSITGDFPDARLLLAGTVPKGETHPKLLNLEKELPANARYLGFRSDTARLLHAADYLVLPSYGEAMPLSISEAMMAGRAVIARDVGDVGYQIGDKRGFLFSGNGWEPLEATLRDALGDREEGMRRGVAAQKFALENLCHSGQVKQVWDFCSKIAG